MITKLFLGTLALTSILFATSTTCQVGSAQQRGSTFCSATAGGVTVDATASLTEFFSGNQFNLNAGTDIEVRGQPPAGMGNAYPASGTAFAGDTINLPKNSPDDTYRVNLGTFVSDSYSQATIDFSGQNLSGCTPVFKGEQCSFSLSAAQLSSFSVVAVSSVSNLIDGQTAASGVNINLTIDQFGPNGEPVAFSPEPASFGLMAIALLPCVFRLYRRNKTAKD